MVVDASVPLSSDARAVLEQTRERPRVVFYNKADLGRMAFDARDASEAEALLGSAFDPATPQRVAAALPMQRWRVKRPTSRGRTWRPRVKPMRPPPPSGPCGWHWIHFDAGQPADLLATDLTNALAALDELLGRDVTEAMLDRIFARFCIGK